MKQAASIIGVFLLCMGMVHADLDNYPKMFVGKHFLEVFIVVGDQAPASHVVAQTNLLLTLSQEVDTQTQGLTKLASEVEDLDDFNIISLGNACINEVSAEILGSSDCDLDQASIELVEKGEVTHIVLNAPTDESLMELVDVLINHDDYNLRGNEFAIDVAVSEKEPIEEEEEKEPEKKVEEKQEPKPVLIKEDVEEKEPAQEEKKEEIVTESVESQNIFVKFINWFFSLFG